MPGSCGGLCSQRAVWARSASQFRVSEGVPSGARLAGAGLPPEGVLQGCPGTWQAACLCRHLDLCPVHCPEPSDRAGVTQCASALSAPWTRGGPAMFAFPPVPPPPLRATNAQGQRSDADSTQQGTSGKSCVDVTSNPDLRKRERDLGSGGDHLARSAVGRGEGPCTVSRRRPRCHPWPDLPQPPAAASAPPRRGLVASHAHVARSRAVPPAEEPGCLNPPAPSCLPW